MSLRLRRARRLAVGVLVPLTVTAFTLGGAPATAAVTALQPAAHVASTSSGSEPAWTHDPAQPDGPEQWGSVSSDWAACANVGDQSPIGISTTTRARLSALRVDYPRAPLVVENTGHVIEVPEPPQSGGTLSVGGDTYRLVQWHLHTPSEHVINGRRFDMEIHLVHTNSAGQTAVLAVLADVAGAPGRGPGARAASLLDLTVRSAPETAGEETDVDRKVTAADLLPKGNSSGGGTSRVLTDYLTYGGSLTTPPCTPGVRWFVAISPTRVDAATVAQMHQLIAAFPGYNGYPDNKRPLQPLSGRVVYRSND